MPFRRNYGYQPASGAYVHPPLSTQSLFTLGERSNPDDFFMATLGLRWPNKDGS